MKFDKIKFNEAKFTRLDTIFSYWIFYLQSFIFRIYKL